MVDDHDCCRPNSELLKKNGMNYEYVRAGHKNFHRGKCTR
jgi:hypothetical protein